MPREVSMYEPRIDKSKLFRVYIGDLGNNGDPEELRRMFSRYGSVQDVWVAHKPPGFAFVFYKTGREAREAVKGADGRMVCGVRVRVRMGTEINQAEVHHMGREFERGYDSPPRERSRTSSSYQPKGYPQSRGARHSDRHNYEVHSPPRPSPPHRGARPSPPRGNWSSRGGRRSVPHPPSMGRGYSSSRSRAEDVYSPPPPSSHKYGGHKRSYDTASHYTPPNDRFTRDSGSRVTSRHHTSPDRLPRYSPPADISYHGNKRGASRYERHNIQQYDQKERSQRSRHKEHVYPKMSQRHHRSRSPHLFSPPPMKQHDRRHGNKGGWGGYDNQSPPPPRRSHYDDNHDHRGYRERGSRDEQFERGSFSSERGDRGSRKDYVFDGARYDNSSRYSSSRSNEHSYKPADREVKYRGQRYPSSERFSGQLEYHNEPYIREDRVEYVERDRSDRGSSLEGIGVDDDFSDVLIVERDPNDLRRKLLSDGDNEREVREAASSERGYKRVRSDDKPGARITSPIRV